jgi:uncharacterized membrane protein (DUF441 family)
MQLSNQLTGLIRTWVPIAVGGVFSWLATQGLALDGETQAGAIVALTGVTQAVYYTLVRLLEQQWPAAGWLLGKASAPTYKK